MANVTVTTAAVYIPELWTKQVEKPFDKALYSADVVTRRDALVSSGGDTIHVPFVASVDARNKAASTNVTYDANTESEVTVSINKHKYFAFTTEYISVLQSNYALQELYRERGMEAVLRAIDTDLLGLHASAGTNVSGGATIDDADFLSAVYALDAGEIPQENRSAIVGHKFMNDLRGINKFTAYDQTGKTGLAVSGKANVPNLYGVDIYQSGNVADDTTNTHNLMFHKSGLSLAVQQKPKFHMEESVDVLGTKCAVDAVYGVAVERAAAVVDIERTS